MFSHVDDYGKAKMVDVSDKNITFRKAYAMGSVCVGEDVLDLIIDNNIKKGDVLGCAKIAGIMAAKRVGELIPLCHPLNLTFVNIDFQYDFWEDSIIIFSEAAVNAPTGVEMEALAGVNIAALTIYDMCKGIDKEIVIGESFLVKKTGGKSGLFKNKFMIVGYLSEQVTVNKKLKLDKDLIIGIHPGFLDDGDILTNNKYKINVKIDNGDVYLCSEKPILLEERDEIWIE